MGKTWKDGARRRRNGTGARNKYKNTKVTDAFGEHASKREYNRFCELRLLEQAGEIRDLERQVRFTLIPSQYEDDGIHTYGINAGRKKRGKCLERPLVYVADFVYWQKAEGADGDEWEYIVEDAKGYRTRDYVIKRKLMLWLHKIRIKEV